MSRRLASPDADTRSYWPPPPPPPLRINATISFEDPASLRWMMQPFSFWNAFANEGSEYAAHSIRLREPSPFPIDVGRPLLLLVPAAGTHSAAAIATTSTWPLLIRLTSRFPPWGFRRCAPASIPAGHACLAPRAPAAMR